MQKFELKRVAEIAPGCGEDLGAILARFADGEEQRCRALPNGRVSYWASPVVQVLYLAAEAFEAGASASIGHNRSDRYEQRAQELRRHAEALEAEMKTQRDDEQAERLMKCFLAGYEGDDGKRFSFDNREAYLVGKFYADQNRPIPSRINKVYTARPLGRDSERDHLVVDGERFTVEYPGGKVADAIVTRLDV